MCGHIILFHSAILFYLAHFLTFYFPLFVGLLVRFPIIAALYTTACCIYFRDTCELFFYFYLCPAPQFLFWPYCVNVFYTHKPIFYQKTCSLKFVLPPTQTQKFALPPTPTPNVSRWNIGGVGSQTQNSHVGHVDFMLFVHHFLSWKISQRKRRIRWNTSYRFLHYF